jgi:hypothetical protein
MRGTPFTTKRVLLFLLIVVGGIALVSLTIGAIFHAQPRQQIHPQHTAPVSPPSQ